MTPPSDAAPIVVVCLQHVTITEPEYDTLELNRGDVVALPIPLFHQYSGSGGHFRLCICDQAAPQNKKLVKIARVWRAVGR